MRGPAHVPRERKRAEGAPRPARRPGEAYGDLPPRPAAPLAAIGEWRLPAHRRTGVLSNGPIRLSVQSPSSRPSAGPAACLPNGQLAARIGATGTRRRRRQRRPQIPPGCSPRQIEVMRLDDSERGLGRHVRRMHTPAIAKARRGGGVAVNGRSVRVSSVPHSS